MLRETRDLKEVVVDMALVNCTLKALPKRRLKLNQPYGTLEFDERFLMSRASRSYREGPYGLIQQGELIHRGRPFRSKPDDSWCCSPRSGFAINTGVSFGLSLYWWVQR